MSTAMTLRISTVQDNIDNNNSASSSQSQLDESPIDAAATDDDNVESEVCQKLIRLSFAKIVSSKHERGGAKLHRNLLILHLLQKARIEQNHK